ncbi:outer membrane beta-barrel protein [Chitinophaga sp. CF118]|uniref:outer membrane beta-barrel protein n=1 Tax=Chitinophaga sp. CF118 TaxID=1884367 RepID=UPI0015A63C55|nr:outer membrane beta-barrel protein [Chitinophaga sp. CF118]
MKLLKTIPSLLILLLTTLLAAGQQTGAVNGTLSDTTNHLQLKNAYISLHRTSDSSMQRSFFSGENGVFSTGEIHWGAYYLRISYTGYETLKIPVTLDKAQSQIDLGTIYMSSKTMVLDTIVILEPPIVLNKDTLEYNASRFKTRDYAALEDLLKLLPGIQLNYDGSITINGQVVDQLMVDGKPFFDGTPAMALSHLPADIVKKIQVYASSTASTTGIPPPPGFPGPKTLNIILKADRRKGSFGKLMAGAGSGGAYTSNGDLNHMNGAQQFSLIGNAGNVEKDKGGNVGYVTNGITRNINGGINYRDSRSEKNSITGSVLANNVYTKNTQRSHLLNIFPDDLSTIQDQQTQSEAHVDFQQINLNLEQKFNNKDVFLFQPRVTVQHSNNNSRQQSLQRYESSGDTIYRSSGNTATHGNTTMLSSLIQYSHNWKKPGEKLTIAMNISGNNGINNGTSNTTTISTVGTTTLNRHSTSKNGTYTLAPYVNFTTPIGEKNVLNVAGNYTDNKSTMRYQVYRFNDNSHQYDIQDTTQSNNYKTDYKTAAMQFSFSRQWKRTSFTAGTGIQSDWLEGDNESNHTSINSHFFNALPSAMLTVNLNNMKNLQVSYNGRPTMVSVEQLQPVSMTSDSLYISEGNPNLKQPYAHTMNLIYNAINISKNSFFSATLMGTITQNSIQQYNTMLNNGAQLTKPVNLEGAHVINLVLNYGLNAIKKKSILNISANASYNKSPVVSNGVRNDSRIIAAMTNITYDYQQAEGFNLTVRISQGYNAMQSKLGTNQNYFTTSLGTKAVYFKGNWETSIAADYSYNTSLPSSYQPRYPITVPSIAFRILNHKEGQIRVSVMDLFNQQSGVSKTISSSMVSDSWTQTRGRYIIGTFTWNFRKFGTKK